MKQFEGWKDLISTTRLVIMRAIAPLVPGSRRRKSSSAMEMELTKLKLQLLFLGLPIWEGGSPLSCQFPNDSKLVLPSICRRACWRRGVRRLTGEGSSKLSKKQRFKFFRRVVETNSASKMDRESPARYSIFASLGDGERKERPQRIYIRSMYSACGIYRQ